MPRSNHGWTGNDRFVYAALTVPNLMVMCMALANRHWPAAYLTFGLACIYVCCLLSTLGWLKPERYETVLHGHGPTTRRVGAVAAGARHDGEPNHICRQAAPATNDLGKPE